MQPIVQNYDHKKYKQQKKNLFEQTDYQLKIFIINFLIKKYIICSPNNKGLKRFSVHLNKKV
jgi:hypothetical protein